MLQYENKLNQEREKLKKYKDENIQKDEEIREKRDEYTKQK